MMTHLKNKKLVIASAIITLFMAVASPFQASAYDITTTVSPTGNSWEWGSSTAWNVYTQDVASGNIGVANYTGEAIYIRGNLATTDYSKGSNIVHRSIRSSNRIEFKEGNYYITTISFGLSSKENIPIEMTELERVTVPDNAPYKFVSVSPQYNSCWEITEGSNTVQGNVVLRYLSQTGCSYGAITFTFIFQATRTDTGTFQIGNGSAWTFRNHVWITDTGSYTFGTVNAQTITEYKPDNIESINEQQQEAGEQAQQEAQQGSDQSQTDAEQGSASLLQGASTIVSALTDTQASDCTINLNMGVLDMGTQNFCQGDIGPIRPIIATITNILFAFVSFKVFAFLIGVMFGLFDQFFGTKTEKGGSA